LHATVVRDLLVLGRRTGWRAVPWGSEFIVSLALTCLMYVALSTSWALFCGTTRYLSLATSAFFGLGAYASAIVARRARRVPPSCSAPPSPARWRC
jgi:branched-chain amino acid transport system permease protein